MFRGTQNISRKAKKLIDGQNILIRIRGVIRETRRRRHEIVQRRIAILLFSDDIRKIEALI